MSGTAGEVAVVDVLEHGFPGRLAVFVDGDGSESGGIRWTKNKRHFMSPENTEEIRILEHARLCDAKSLGLRLAQVTLSTELQECADCVCAEDSCRCWFVFTAESGGTVSRVAERTCGGAAGREESVRPCGTIERPSRQNARCEFVLDGLDCGNLECWLHEGMLGNGDVKQSSDESRIASRSAGISSHLHDDHGIGAAGFDKKLDFTERLDDLTLAAICYADDVVLIAFSVSAAETMVSEVIEKLKEVGTDGWRTENTLDEFPEDDGQKHHGGRIGWGVGGSFGVCGIDGVSGRECTTCDRTQNSTSQQMPCKKETCFDFPMAPQIVAVEHREDCDVAGFPLVLEVSRRRSTHRETKIASWSARMGKNRQDWSWDSGGDSGTGQVIVGSRNAI